MQEDKQALDLLKRYDDKVNERSNYDTTWEDIATYIRLEGQGIVTKKSEGEERTDQLYDDTAIQANTRLAAVLRYMLTDVNTQFFYLRTGDDELDNNYNVREWLDDASKRMLRAIYQSNFANACDELYLDLGSFNTACMYTEEGRSRLLNFRTRNVSEFVFCEDSEGEKTEVYVDYEYTTVQAISLFGKKNLHPAMVENVSKDPHKKHKFIHVVIKREDADITKLKSKNMPYASYWIDKDNKFTVRESGYMEMPYSIVRWRKMTNSPWGFGPGQQTLPTIRILNEREKLNLRLERKFSDPPMWAQDGSIDGPLRTGAGRVNWGTPQSTPPVPLNTVNPSGMTWSEEKAAQYRDRVYNAFYINQLSLINQADMTATEVIQRTEENMRVMGPTFERIVREFLDPVINRIFGIMLRAGQFLQPPKELQGVDLDIQYESPLARSNKGQNFQNTAATIEFLGGAANVLGPEVIDWAEPDEWIKKIIESQGLTYKSDEDVAEVRTARAQAAQEAMQMQAMQAGVETAATASQIKPQQQ